MMKNVQLEADGVPWGGGDVTRDVGQTLIVADEDDMVRVILLGASGHAR